MTKRNPLPSYELVRELFDYDPQSGVLRWRVNRANKRVGDVAGCQRPSGYWQVGINGKIYRVHLIIWLWMTGAEPSKFIDHENTFKGDNRWENLREATKSQNMANRSAQKNSTSGLKGVFWYAAYDKWTSQIWKDGKAYFLGYFDVKADAKAAYDAKQAELFGEFARA